VRGEKWTRETLDTVAANYIHARAEADSKTPAQIIEAMGRKEMAARLSSSSVAL